LKYTEDAINLASEIGNVEALQWWFDSGLDSKYDSRAVDRACEFGQLEVLDAWKHSGLELKYTSAAIRTPNGPTTAVFWHGVKTI